MTASSHVEQQIGLPNFYKSPSDAFYALRQQGDVVWSPSLESWLVFSYELSRQALNDERLSVVRAVSTVGRMSPQEQRRFRRLDEFYGRWLLLNDPPRHTQLRDVCRSAFAFKTLQKHERMVIEIIDRVLADLGKRSRFDIVTEFANPVAAEVVLRIIGLPDVRVTRAVAWSATFVEFLLNREPLAADAEAAELCLHEILNDIMYHRMSSYGRDRSSTIYRPSNARSRDDDIWASILVDGIGPLSGSLALAVYIGLSRKGLWRDWANTETRLTNEATGELLRLASHFRYVARYSKQSLQLDGVTIAKGQRVMFLLDAANRDSRQFCSPDEFDPTANGGKNMSFGHGIHRCLGFPLASTVLGLALPRLSQKFPGLVAAQRRPIWKRIFALHALERLPVLVSE